MTVPPLRLLLGHGNKLRGKAHAPEDLGHEDQLDGKPAARRAAAEASHRLAATRIADCNREILPRRMIGEEGPVEASHAFEDDLMERGIVIDECECRRLRHSMKL